MIPQAIGFFGWKRPQIAAKTLRGLARCHGIERWPLIAFLDAGSDPATTKAIEGWTASPLLGIRQSADRLGCSGNLTRGIMDLFDLCSDRFIVLEDDVYPAEGFIDGLRVGLNRFQSAHTIKSIAAYNPSENRKRGICGDVPGFHCWGWGTWADRRPFFEQALLPVRGDAHDDSWDVRLCRHPEARCVVPRLCHTLNIGTIDWTHTPGEDLTPEEWAGSENPRDIRQ